VKEPPNPKDHKQLLHAYKACLFSMNRSFTFAVLARKNFSRVGINYMGQ